MGRLARGVLSVIVLMSVWVGVGGRVAIAAELVTDFPAVSVRPGDTATFEVRLVSSVREQVELAVSDAPEGWVVRMLGAGREIGAVFADPDPAVSPTVNVEVEVPVDAAAGTYVVGVGGSAASGTSTLTLKIMVTELASAPFELTAEFPELSGGADQSFSFDVNVANNTGQDATFAIEATGPPGWEVQARPTGQTQATTLTVAGGQAGTLQVQATPAPETTEGRYPIDVRITADGVPVEGQFTAVVVGSPLLVITPTDERLSLSGEAGGTSTFSITVANQGTASLTDVTLSASAPTNWDVTFEPASIAAVEPGQTVTVLARVRPQGDAVAGDYALSVTASAEGASEALDVRFQVKTSTWWGVIAVALIVAALAALAFVFRRYGRR